MKRTLAGAILLLLAVVAARGPVASRAADVAAQRGPDLSAALPGALWVGADPWVVFHEGHYYHCGSTRGRIEVWRSSKMDERGERVVVWRAPATGWNQSEVWAPELH